MSKRKQTALIPAAEAALAASLPAGVRYLITPATTLALHGATERLQEVIEDELFGISLFVGAQLRLMAGAEANEEALATLSKALLGAAMSGLSTELWSEASAEVNEPGSRRALEIAEAVNAQAPRDRRSLS
ncbi:hypothetical protein E8L99_16595 [Phreatobacter aquaticus]|uniref:Uncharacterized protein n=1 Tax=Phreatobacter aquaticus TaxID=2570229 RepID=A0A4D7QKZ0_9HYPH|nr:hypothetical protein [Phreatobacter aquaticus]QCK87261.1 hypothetical protein E8L99_16595 [Phreatobacter aquaticus]